MLWGCLLLTVAAAPAAPAAGKAAVAPAAASEAAPEASALLKEADRARGGLEGGVSWTVEVESTEDGVKSSRTFLVKARGNDSLAESTAPPRSKGEMMLFNDRTLWFFKPGLRKPVSISARQKLSGMTANGDIASTNYARDYEGTVVGQESVGDEPAYKLELKARAKNVTYDRIRYWISVKRRLGLKAEFLTVGGDLFKVATFDYKNRLKVDGKELDFVSAMTIRDASNAENVSVIRFSEPKAVQHPPSIFNINNVVH